MPIARSTHPKPLIPEYRDQLIRKKIIVKGAKIAKSKGQSQRLNTELNKEGFISHHTSIANRGPKSIKIENTQHILFLPHQMKINLLKSIFLSDNGHNNHYN
jgi:hypothetical protein